MIQINMSISQCMNKVSWLEEKKKFDKFSNFNVCYNNIISSMFHLTSDLGCLDLATFWKNYLEKKKAF